MDDRDAKRLELAETKRDELRHAFRFRDTMPAFPGDVDSLVIQRELRCTFEQSVAYRRLFREFGLYWGYPPHPPTLHAFNVAKLKELKREYPDATLAVLRDQTLPNYYANWWMLVEAYGKRLGQFKAQYLTRLTQGERRTLVKFYSECIPRGYVLPECR